MNLQILIAILEASKDKNGADKPLTVGHMLNICKFADKVRTHTLRCQDKEHKQLMEEIDPLGQG